MKFSSKVQKCGLSPMRKFHPYAVAARAAGKKIYHLNIGQPDIPTPAACFEAVRKFSDPVLAYAPSPGIPELIDAVRGYYRRLNVELTEDDVLATVNVDSSWLDVGAHTVPVALTTSDPEKIQIVGEYSVLVNVTQ